MNQQDWLEKLFWHGKPVGRHVMIGFDKVFMGLLAFDLTLGKSSDLPRGPATILFAGDHPNTSVGFSNFAHGDEMYEFIRFAKKYA